MSSTSKKAVVKTPATAQRNTLMGYFGGGKPPTQSPPASSPESASVKLSTQLHPEKVAVAAGALKGTDVQMHVQDAASAVNDGSLRDPVSSPTESAPANIITPVQIPQLKAQPVVAAPPPALANPTPIASSFINRPNKAMDDDDDEEDGLISVAAAIAKRRASAAATGATAPAPPVPAAAPSTPASLFAAAALAQVQVKKPAAPAPAPASKRPRTSTSSGKSSGKMDEDEDAEQDDEDDDDEEEDEDEEDEDIDVGRRGKAKARSAPSSKSKAKGPSSAGKRKRDEPDGGAGEEGGDGAGDGAQQVGGTFPAGQHLHDSLSWLKPASIKDSAGRRPDHHEYDARTLFVPEAYYKDVTPAQQQWWNFKREYFDTVLFFKQGKFYELFNQDADIGVSEAGLAYMKGTAAHAGFPEICYGAVSGQLVSRGYRVARVEQTENPEAMKVRLDYMRTAGLKKKDKTDGVMRRELCSIKSKGTLTSGVLDVYAGATAARAAEELQSQGSGGSGGGGLILYTDGAYGDISALNAKLGGRADNARALVAIKEVQLPVPGTRPGHTSSHPVSVAGADLGAAGAGPVLFGIAIIDTSACEVRMAQFVDDAHRSRLRTLISRVRPAELVYEMARGSGSGASSVGVGLTEWTRRVLQYDVPSALHTPLRPGLDFWSAARTCAEFRMEPYAALLSKAYERCPGSDGTLGSGAGAAPASSSSPASSTSSRPTAMLNMVDPSVVIEQIKLHPLPPGYDRDGASLVQVRSRDYYLLRGEEDAATPGVGTVAVQPGPDGKLRAVPSTLQQAMDRSGTIEHDVGRDRDAAAQEAELAQAAAVEAGVETGERGSASFSGCDTPLGPTALSALGGAVHVLRRHLIDHTVLSMRRVCRYSHADGVEGSLAMASGAGEATSAHAQGEGVRVPHMVLDGTALAHLEMLENGDGGRKGSMLGMLDTCASAAGRARLRAWLAAPLLRVADLNDRLDGVENLMLACGRAVDEKSHMASLATELSVGGLPGAALHEQVRKALSGMPDLERLLARIHSSGSRVVSRDHPDARAIFYESDIYSKRKIGDLLAALNAFRTAQSVRTLFHSKAADGSVASWVRAPLLFRTAHSSFPDLEPTLSWFEKTYDMSRIAKDGKVEPSPGVDPAFDKADSDMRTLKASLRAYEAKVQVELKASGCKYGNEDLGNKDPYLLEVPEAAKGRVPDDWRLVGQRKGSAKQGTTYKYVSPDAEELVATLSAASERKAEASRDALRKLFARFDSHASAWQAAASCIATLDVLFALAAWSGRGDGGDMCRPVFSRLEGEEEGRGAGTGTAQEPFLHLQGARHPALAVAISGGSGLAGTVAGSAPSYFIPNDLALGKRGGSEGSEGGPLAVLLTGPNMGGKSTYLRTACAAVVLAQLGAYVPARVCELTPVDRIFTRMGAHDRILAGQSTFFVELAETAVILGQASRRSLVILDELGRGTSTFDGAAIAYAVTKHLIESIRCRTLFATHYHTLCDDFSSSDLVALGHMRCITAEREDGSHDVTFLYQYGPGACPASHGLNVARLARLPEDVIVRAKEKAAAFEAAVQRAHAKAQEARAGGGFVA